MMQEFSAEEKKESSASAASLAEAAAPPKDRSDTVRDEQPAANSSAASRPGPQPATAASRSPSSRVAADRSNGGHDPLLRPPSWDYGPDRSLSRTGSDESSLYYEDSVAGDYSVGLDEVAAAQAQKQQQSTNAVVLNGDSFLTPRDLEIYRRLDQEYEQALEERDVAYQARYLSVRQSACSAVIFMGIFLTVSCIFFVRQTHDWDVADALLFSVYTITTVGYGHLHNPTTPGFQLYTIFFILVGIALLTIMVAQVYQCLALEASRAQASRDSALGTSLSSVVPMPSSSISPTAAADNLRFMTHNNNSWMAQHHRSTTMARQHSRRSSNHHSTVVQIGDMLHVPSHWMDRLFAFVERTQVFLRDNDIGRGISVLFPFVGLILIGAIVIGPLEGWSVTESLYFSVVSLTTVGFGEYFPSRRASVWFVIFWLPFSVGFMSLYLTNVAAFYIRLSDRNIQRIEKQLQQRVEEAKSRLEQERKAARRRALRGQEHAADSGDEEGGGGGGNSTDDDDMPQNHHSLCLPEEITTVATRTSTAAAVVGGARSSPQRAQRRMGSRRAGRGAGFNTLPMTEESPRLRRRKSTARKLFGTRGCVDNRRERILKESQLGDDSGRGGAGRLDGGTSDRHIGDNSSDGSAASSSRATTTMTSMRDVLRTVHFNLESNSSSASLGPLGGSSNTFRTSGLFSIRSFETLPNSLRRDERVRKPSFALRVLVQERLAEIIATDVAGYQDAIDITEHTLSVTINSLKETAERWRIPRRARKAFRAVAFEALFFVGEYGLVTRGAEALYDLSPLVFHGLFAPLLAALGDAEMMEAWLARTQVLADVDLRNTPAMRRGSSAETGVDPVRPPHPSTRDSTRPGFADS